MRSVKAKPAGNSVILLIAIFKLVKGLALVAVGIGLLHLLHKDVEETTLHWINMLRIDPDNHYVHRGLTRVFRVTPKQLKELSLGTFLYAALFLTEGIGLLMRKRWAEYFTIITTASLIPLEIYELSKHLTPAKLLVLAINIAIVIYLVQRVRKTSA
jgi:uncharacterized membrane protein (DUF2068 family)